MSTLRNKLILLAAVGIFAVVGTLFNSRKANAQGGGPAVTIAAPLPVPVQVNNTVTDPVRVRNVNDAIQPFQAAATCSSNIVLSCSATIFTVPAGKRAVIEYFSGEALTSVGNVAFASVGGTIVGSSNVSFSVPQVTVTSTGGGAGTWGQQVRIYADSG